MDIEKRYKDLKHFAKDKVYGWKEGRVDRAFQMAREAHDGQFRASNKKFITHPIDVAEILASLRCDLPTFISALLHDVIEDSEIPISLIEQYFDRHVMFIVNALTKLNLEDFDEGEHRDLNQRKLLVGSAQNVRVAYVKLADRLHNVNTLQVVSDNKRKRVINETIDFYVPLANAIGIRSLSFRLHNASLFARDPVAFKKIKEPLKQQNQIDEEFLDQVWVILYSSIKNRHPALKSIMIDSLMLQPQIYEIEPNLETISNEEIFIRLQRLPLILQVWITTDGKNETDLDHCLSVVSTIHNLWPPIHSSFRDYISAPEANGYMALHTTVIGPEGRRIEFRVSTSYMHRVNEYGPLANIELISMAPNIPVSVSRRILELDQEISDTHQFIAVIKRDILSPKIRVFSDKGECIWLPVGSTLLDYAYQVSETLGHCASMAEIDGQLTSLDQILEDGCQVKILIRDSIGPDKRWKEFVRTEYARYKINELLLKSEGLH